jgi:hypothetical protein
VPTVARRAAACREEHDGVAAQLDVGEERRLLLSRERCLREGVDLDLRARPI